MTPERWQRICDLFDQARQIDPEARDALLRTACDGDPELRAEVERLLADDAGASRDGFLDVPDRIGHTRPADPREARRPHRALQAAPADRRGRHGRRLHGRAGAARPPQGRAQDHQAGHGHRAGHRPLRGRAPGPGADGPPEHRPGPRRRHHRHPAGPTSSWSWSTACRSPSTATGNQLTPRERLELFVPVCQAIQHAHQKGIIHRDIKPSNVLVTLHDGKPVPKVIDFGVAKAIDQRLTEQTLFTAVRRRSSARSST